LNQSGSTKIAFFFHFRFCSRWRMSGCVSCLFRRDGDAAAQQNNTRAHGQGVGGVDKSLSEDFQHMLPNLVNIEKTIENGPVEIVDIPSYKLWWPFPSFFPMFTRG
jgi:hypothetical protein